jgi:hypothetical protein
MRTAFYMSRHICKSCGAVAIEQRSRDELVRYWIPCLVCDGMMVPDPTRPLIERPV